ncbi:DUF7344 domain-containing protein [Halobellus rarus]|uniref:DUF7344 domain-containing protein n=1 Tax=Halobellus rarus TaxID=1126237 RepID=A0ABD6CJW1_9EURY|nr:hypothetical protein [Halobellus rarus]
MSATERVNREQRTEEPTDVEGSAPDALGRTTRRNGSSLSKDETFDLLKNSRRRGVIRYLHDHGGSAVLSDVAEHIAAEENGVTVRELSSDQRKRVYIGLYQSHLPKLDSAGVIEYDKNRGTIERQDSLTQLEEYLDIEGQETEGGADRNGAVLAVAACVVGLVTLGVLGIGGLSAIPAAGWTLVSVVGIIAIVGLQYRNRTVDPD